MKDKFESDREDNAVREPNVIIGVCREDNPQDVDEAYGEGTYARLFPEQDEPDEREAQKKTLDAIAMQMDDIEIQLRSIIRAAHQSNHGFESFITAMKRNGVM
jgi:hypothetical protein